MIGAPDAPHDRERLLHAVAEGVRDLYSSATAAATLAATRDADGDRPGAEKLYKEALAVIATTGYGQLRADIQRELARHYIRHGRPHEAAPLIEALVAFYRDPLAERRRAEAEALRRAAEVTLPV